MADTGRANSQEEAGDSGRRREELDALLQRIAAHVAEVEKRQSAAPANEESANQGPAAAAEASEGQGSAAGLSGLSVKGGISEQDLKAARRALRRARLQSELGFTNQSEGRTAPPTIAAESTPAPAGHASNSAERAPVEPAVIAPELHSTGDPVADAADQATTHLRRPLGAVEPPALRSALGAARQVEPPRRLASLDEGLDDDHDTPAAAPGRTPVTGAEPKSAERVPQVSDSPWDIEQAEALTRSYETQAVEPPLRSMLDIMSQQMPPSTSAARTAPRASMPGSAPMAAAAAAVPVADTAVMSAVRRVEAALELLAPRNAIEALDHRFTMLELEVQRSGGQLQRLDQIEGQLGQLADKLSDEQIVALFGNLVPTAEDLTQFAEDAAGRAAERVLEARMSELAMREPSAIEAATPGPELRQLTEQLSSFMDDRRRSDAGTLDALETLQLAMQHLLDRLDRVEERAVAGADDVPPARRTMSAPAGAPMAMAADPRPTTFAPEAHREAGYERHHEPQFEPYAQSPARAVPVDLDTMPDAPGYDEARPPRTERQPQGHGARDEIAATFTMRDRLDHKLPGDDIEPTATGAGDIPQPAAPPVSDRQAFIAMARKAAERAKAEASAQAGQEKGQKGSKPRAPATSQQSDEPSTPTSGGVSSVLSGLGGGVRPAVLVVALVATLLLLAYMFIAGPKLNLNFGFGRGQVTQSEPEETEQQADPAPAATEGRKPGAQPDLEKDSRATDAPEASKLAGAPPAPQDAEPMREASYRLPVAATSALGISVQESAAPANPEQVMQSRERARLAALSHRTAVAASTNHPAPAGTTFIETSSLSQPGPGASQGQVTSPAKAAQLELPPAAAGPLSLRLAAAKGDASAQLEIATRLAEGKGIKQNLAQAVIWYRRAAEQDEPVAQYRLATLYERGMGGVADPKAAAMWYRRAADLGNLKAQHNLAVISASPSQGSPDYTTAAQLFTKAADSGLADSQYNLGVLYESGLGVPKDHAVAYKWYTLAAKSGDIEAARRRDQLIARLPAETVQAGERLVATFRPQASSARANNARFAGESWKQTRAATTR